MYVYTCTREWYTFLILRTYMYDYKIRIHVYFYGVHTSFTYIRIGYSRVHKRLRGSVFPLVGGVRTGGGARIVGGVNGCGQWAEQRVGVNGWSHWLQRTGDNGWGDGVGGVSRRVYGRSQREGPNCSIFNRERCSTVTQCNVA